MEAVVLRIECAGGLYRPESASSLAAVSVARCRICCNGHRRFAATLLVDAAKLSEASRKADKHDRSFEVTNLYME